MNANLAPSAAWGGRAKHVFPPTLTDPRARLGRRAEAAG